MSDIPKCDGAHKVKDLNGMGVRVLCGERVIGEDYWGRTSQDESDRIRYVVSKAYHTHEREQRELIKDQRSPGATMIGEERSRQVHAEGYTPEHDAEHDDGELIRAAQAYLVTAYRQAAFIPQDGVPPQGKNLWPWSDGWKPSEDPIPNLVKAGALIAAEIDRLLLVRTPETTTEESHA